jgi:2-haloacid dehalogenase
MREVERKWIIRPPCPPHVRFAVALRGKGRPVAQRPTVVAFDVNETLFSLDLLTEGIVEAGLPAEAAKVWFARVLRDGFAVAAAGGYIAFRDLAATHLEHLVGPGEAVLRILGRIRRLPAQPDVEPAFQRLRDAGVRIVTLTNAHADTVATLVDRAGLSTFVEACLSVDEAGCWKPRPEPYHYAASYCGVEPAEVALVAVHSWDIHGANRAGLTTGYSPRLEGAFIDGFDPPDVLGESLVQVAEGLLALPAAP